MVYTVTLSSPRAGGYDVTLDAANDRAAKALASRQRDAAGKGWRAVLYRTDAAGLLHYVATRDAAGWRS